MNWRGFDSRLLSAIMHIWGYGRSFEVKKTWFKVVECNCTHLRILRSFELKNAEFECFEIAKAHLNYKNLIQVIWRYKSTFLNWNKLDMNDLRVDMQSWIEVEFIWVVWGCISKFELTKTCFEKYEGEMHINIVDGLIWMI